MSATGVNTTHSSPVAHEMSEELESGRTRFTQSYRFAPGASTRRAHASSSTDGGANLMQRESETKEAVIEAHANTTTSAGGIMGDLAELNGYYRKP